MHLQPSAWPGRPHRAQSEQIRPAGRIPRTRQSEGGSDCSQSSIAALCGAPFKLARGRASFRSAPLCVAPGGFL